MTIHTAIHPQADLPLGVAALATRMVTVAVTTHISAQGAWAGMLPDGRVQVITGRGRVAGRLIAAVGVA